MTAKDLSNGFSPETTIARDDTVWINARTEPFKIYGVFFDDTAGRFLRMPLSVSDQMNDRVQELNTNPSGGRLRFCTDSDYVAVYAVQENFPPIPCITLDAQSGMDLYEDGQYYKTFAPKANCKTGFSDLKATSGGFHEITINLPLLDNLIDLYIGLQKDAVVLEAPAYPNEGKPIVFYGSSITQGMGASRPGNTYVSQVCRRLGLDFINLGFSGNCKGEQCVAHHIAGLPMTAFVLDFDHNVSSLDELKERHMPFFRTVRAANPDLPIVMISAPDTAYGKTINDMEERRLLIIKNYETLVAEGDRNVYFIDGKTILGDHPKDCTVDALHPNDLGFFNMANVVEKKLREVLKDIL